MDGSSARASYSRTGRYIEPSVLSRNCHETIGTATNVSWVLVNVMSNSSSPASASIRIRNEAGTIQAYLKQLDVLPGSWEIVVADSGSTDGTRDIVMEFPGGWIVDALRRRGARV